MNKSNIVRFLQCPFRPVQDLIFIVVSYFQDQITDDEISKDKIDHSGQQS